jgi:hypothetical protein
MGLALLTAMLGQQRAGEVAAEVTHASIERVGAKSRVEAAKGTEIDWQDVLSTDSAGRARLRLDDSSVLTLGSNSKLRVVQHDATAQQTELELRTGKIRCQISPLKGANSSFRLHTPSAVVGVIGTDFGADASVPGETKFICISGTVRIFSLDESSYVDCAPGETVTVAKGAKPPAATAAAAEQIERWKHITEPGDPAFAETLNPQAPAAPKPVRWHGLTITGNGRVRVQAWNNFQNTAGNGTYGFLESFFKLGIGQTREHFQWQVELMQPTLLGVPTKAVVAAPQGQLGLGGSYFAANDSSQNAASLFPSKAFVRWTGWGGKPANQVTVGRFEFIDGTETKPANATLAWLKDQRIAHRLIGNFAFSLVGRSEDGVNLGWNKGRANLTFAAARPTRGVFQVDGLGELDVAWQYGALTLATGSGKSSGDLRIFGLGYQDARAVAKTDNRAAATRNGADRFSNINIGTIGMHYLHQLDAGAAGTFDWLVWGAAQFGQWGVQQHRAGALVLETGWQPHGIAWKPWFRAGYTYGSGDGNPNDNRHGSFFQVLPTPRIYARFPFYNMENSNDASGVVILRPIAKLTLRSDVHSLWLSSRKDSWYSGGGAFQPRTFGYTGRPSGGLRGLANVWDASADYRVSPHWGVGFYYGHAWGKGVLHSIYPKQPNGDFGYTELLYRF